MRILVAEDDITIRTWLQVNLHKWGYDLDLAKDGAEAIRLYSKYSHNIAIIDWVMPIMDGIELISKIRDRNSVAKTYIIMISSKNEGGDLISGISAGADDYIVKPVKPEELHARVIAAERILLLEQELQQRNDSLNHANSQMKQDMALAARIQQSFLPHTPPKLEKVVFEWGLLSCDALAGDALNVIRLDEDHVGFYILDVSGHGVAAALLAMTLIHTLSADKPNSLLFHTLDAVEKIYAIRPPSEVATRLNQQFPMDDIIGQYFTFIYGILNLKANSVKYVSAGHPGPVVTRSSGTAESFPATGMPVGFFEECQYSEQTIQLNPGDRLYFFSDGIPETTNKYSEQFGSERMQRILHKNQTRFNLRDSIDDLAASALKWNGLSSMKDDVSIVGLEILP